MRAAVPGGPAGSGWLFLMRNIRATSSRQIPRGRTSGGGTLWHVTHCVRAAPSPGSAGSARAGV